MGTVQDKWLSINAEVVLQYIVFITTHHKCLTFTAYVGHTTFSKCGEYTRNDTIKGNWINTEQTGQMCVPQATRSPLSCFTA